MYSLRFYGQMLADASRMDAYTAALRQTVTADSIVMDLGSGPGVFALLACKLGARRVYAVEPASVISVAREFATVNGCADRIQFFENLSTEIALPEPADVIISDLRGVLPWFQQHIPAIKDARTRLLARDGVLIPRRDILWAALVEAPAQYEQLVGPWQKNRFDLNLTAASRFVTNTWRKEHLQPEQLLSEPVCWTTVDYQLVETADMRAEISLQAVREGTAHGFAVWFDSELIDGVSFSNHPRGPETIYGNGLFPFSEPIALRAGDRVQIRLAAKTIEDDYVWRWDSDFFRRENEAQPNASFRQSTFFGVPLSNNQLRHENE
jgi:protein arginine N-methyltransferase 1